MGELRFEWDEAKSLKNAKKHGVSFEEAATVFSDERARIVPDPDHSFGEERFILLGLSSEFNVLTVCHCERDADTIRIISARKAEKPEIRQYQGVW